MAGKIMSPSREQVRDEFLEANSAYAKALGHWRGVLKRYTDAVPGTTISPIPDVKFILRTANLEEMNQQFRELANANKTLREAWRRLHKANKRYYSGKKWQIGV